MLQSPRSIIFYSFILPLIFISLGTLASAGIVTAIIRYFQPNHVGVSLMWMLGSFSVVLLQHLDKTMDRLIENNYMHSCSRIFMLVHCIIAMLFIGFFYGLSRTGNSSLKSFMLAWGIYLFVLFMNRRHKKLL